MPNKRGFIESANKAIIPKKTRLSPSNRAIAEGFKRQIAKTTVNDRDAMFENLLDRLNDVETEANKADEK